ncbi:hypothetical protein [Nitratireductor sp. ZSWI3]|uniref:hypothetical protein n=1 Tax=Nitratireductor sp. ZSWI3 TaxID=2966359 RepID=UPI00214FDF81|nr:hypothetical protein [Nitratireductor sp. ZSWI3]MCR4266241.1 hypothetical protein [Nitratireductor sp. ZSWI3]
MTEFEDHMTLNPPTKLVFLLSLVIAIVAIVAAFNVLPFLPVPAMWIMAIAYVLLAAGCVFKGM